MRRSNFTYVLYQTFNSDLLFWIVIDNLFLTTVKGLSAFDIVLVTLIGIAASLVCYPLTNYIVKKYPNKVSLVLGSWCYVISVLLFMISGSMFGIILGQIVNNLSSPFRQVASVMLKNNLKENNKTEEFVKWESYGKLGYAVITMIISLFAGVLFNVSPYLPMVLSFLCACIGLLLAIFYLEPDQIQREATQSVSVSQLLNHRLMIILLFMNIFTVGIYIFLQSKATLLIQFVCEESNMDLANISLMVSGIVFGSRICRVLSNIFFPSIYKSINKKHRLLYVLCFLIIFASICFAIGGNINADINLKLLLIAIGLYVIISVRDIYATLEKKMIVNNLAENEQRQALVLTNMFGKAGRLCSCIFALFVLGFTPLNILYIYLLVFNIAHICICIPLGKYLKHDHILSNE